jgi:hypothetical protein
MSMSESERSARVRDLKRKRFYRTEVSKDGVPVQVLKTRNQQIFDDIEIGFAERGIRIESDGRGGWSPVHNEITVWDYLR